MNVIPIFRKAKTKSTTAVDLLDPWAGPDGPDPDLIDNSSGDPDFDSGPKTGKAAESTT